MMTKMQKRILLWSVGVMFILGATYFENKQFEIHRIAIALIGIMEGVMVGWCLWKFDKFTSENKWTVNRSRASKTLLCVGLIIVVIIVDRLINHTVALFNKDYKMIWTVVNPGIFIMAQLFKLLDSWAVDNEQKSKI